MTKEKNQDAGLKKMVIDTLSNCGFQKARIDREVQVSISGDGQEPDVEFDVVLSFTDSGKKALVLFECEDTDHASGVKKEYEARESIMRKIKDGTVTVSVIASKDRVIKNDDFQGIDEISACYIYGKRLLGKSLETCQKEANKKGFVVWGYSALKYYKKISTILGKWTHYELFREFGLHFENKPTIILPALCLKQKNQKDMYLAKIHPGQLLKIAYVVRRTSGRSLAYQRMLNKQRIEDIASFIRSNEAHTLLPNTVIIVFDKEKKIQDQIKYSDTNKEITIPLEYCSAWMIDGQHRAYGFIGTKYEEWTYQSYEPFDLPVVIFKNLTEIAQTQTFIDINYNQKKIKPDLLCDLATVTRDLKNKLSWASLLGVELSQDSKSPLHGKVKISEFDVGTLSLSSLTSYGLLETLLGYKTRSKTYTGRLFNLAPFNTTEEFSASVNQDAFKKQVSLLKRFLVGVKKNTEDKDSKKNPWENTIDYSLLRPTGMNALLLVLAKILEKHPKGAVDFNDLLKPLKSVDFTRSYVASMGTGWQGFRSFANEIISKINKGKSKANKLDMYGEKDKI